MNKDDEELQRKLGILREQFKAGKINISSDVYDKLSGSLEAVRMDENGKVDLSTVDASIRAMASAITMFHDREENKKLFL
ncbi:hypothetical protein [Vibrio fortis]|uniref:hypothetical protein n=1 Tax=Vibrio fortis TaxID=212667 RepID=UPI001CD9A1FB|nr:hypothetical protein [Vibrio fortis]